MGPYILSNLKMAVIKGVKSNVLCTGNQLRSIPRMVRPGPDHDTSGGVTPLARLALQAGGPRPDWHPDVLRLLLATGRYAAAVAAVRSVLLWLAATRNEVSRPCLLYGIWLCMLMW